MENQPKKETVTHTMIVMEEEFTDQNGRPLPLDRSSPLDPTAKKTAQETQKAQNLEREVTLDEDGRPIAVGVTTGSQVSVEEFMLDEDGQRVPVGKKTKKQSPVGLQEQASRTFQGQTSPVETLPGVHQSLDEQPKPNSRADNQPTNWLGIRVEPLSEDDMKKWKELYASQKPVSSENPASNASSNLSLYNFAQGPVGKVVESFNNMEQSATNQMKSKSQTRLAIEKTQATLEEGEAKEHPKTD